ncbi:MAG: hypothetical protein ACREUF_07340, partial [Solimonas sp.]
DMNRLKGALARVGLLALSEEEKAALSGEPEVSMAPPQEVVAPAPPLAPEDCVVTEQRDFADVFRERGVAPSPYPAERLLKVLDGLKAMDPATRRVAVEAMDAADDSWTLADVVLDAQSKIHALHDEQGNISAKAAGAAQNAQRELQAREAQEQREIADIRQQMTQLEALLEREVAKAAQEKAAIIATGRATQDAAMREIARLDVEVRRLQDIPNTFSARASADILTLPDKA